MREEAETKRTPAEWALQWVWNQPEVSLALSGMSEMKHVIENVVYAGRSGPGSLNADELALFEEVKEAYERLGFVGCTACQYCMPCPEGVNIPQNFACLNNVSLETSRFRRFLARRTYRKLRNSQDNFDINNPNGNATICTSCGWCSEKCPQKIVIPIELEKVKEILGKRKALF